MIAIRRTGNALGSLSSFLYKNLLRIFKSSAYLCNLGLRLVYEPKKPPHLFGNTNSSELIDFFFDSNSLH